MEEIRSIFTVIAVIVSFWSGYTVRRLWYQANRPLLSAAIKENSTGEDTILFDLVIYNSGNRPATDIYFQAEECQIDLIFTENTDNDIKKELKKLFSKETKIQLLLNSSEVKTAFSGCSRNPSNTDSCILNYEAELPITIHYKDIDGNKYSSKINLHIRDSNGFGGSIWS